MVTLIFVEEELSAWKVGSWGGCGSGSEFGNQSSGVWGSPGERGLALGDMLWGVLGSEET